MVEAVWGGGGLASWPTGLELCSNSLLVVKSVSIFHGTECAALIQGTSTVGWSASFAPRMAPSLPLPNTLST